VAGDEVVPELEAELQKGNWFGGGPDDQRRSIARVLARIGTPLAKMVLERGATSRRAPLRKACEDALAGMGGRG
jgi:HEAT repeat protein